MNTVLSIAVLVLFLVPAPRKYYFRYAITSRQSTLTRGDVAVPLEKGLFADSSILREDSTTVRTFDTTATSRTPGTTRLLVLIEVANVASTLQVTLNVKNILAKSVVGPDTVRATRMELDSALVEEGRRIAKRLSSARP